MKKVTISIHRVLTETHTSASALIHNKTLAHASAFAHAYTCALAIALALALGSPQSHSLGFKCFVKHVLASIDEHNEARESFVSIKELLLANYRCLPSIRATRHETTEENMGFFNDSVLWISRKHTYLC